MNKTITAACLAATFAIGFAADITPCFIEQSYEDVLGRAPNRLEMAAGLRLGNAGASRAIIAVRLTSSAEYKARLVDGWYAEFLHRGANAGERSIYQHLLLMGDTDKQVRAMILGSDEYFGQAGNTDSGFVHQVYTDLLGRAPAPGEENGIIAVLHQGVARMQVAMLIEGSAEFDAREVGAIYEKFLRRGANASELAFWSSLMEQGAAEETLMDALMESDAYASSCRVR